MMCLEEGVIQLPAPVQNFHATYVDNERATFVWDPVESKIDQYEVYYKKLENNTSPASAFEHDAVSFGFNVFGFDLNSGLLSECQCDWRYFSDYQWIDQGLQIPIFHYC